MIARIHDILKKTSRTRQKTVKLSTTWEYVAIDYDKMIEEHEKEDHALVQDFFIRFANFWFKKGYSLHGLIHTKIFDKMLNGVEVEMINVNHFWRLLEGVGFKTIRRERNAFVKIFKHTFLEVQSISNILGQLGIPEKIPKGTKNFDYNDLSGSGIRVMNKIIKEMSDNKITDVVEFLGRENIEKKEVVAPNKSEVIEIISADKFLHILRK